MVVLSITFAHYIACPQLLFMRRTWQWVQDSFQSTRCPYSSRLEALGEQTDTPSPQLTEVHIKCCHHIVISKVTLARVPFVRLPVHLTSTSLASYLMSSRFEVCQNGKTSKRCNNNSWNVVVDAAMWIFARFNQSAKRCTCFSLTNRTRCKVCLIYDLGQRQIYGNRGLTRDYWWRIHKFFA